MCDIYEEDDPAWSAAGMDIERDRLKSLAESGAQMRAVKAEWVYYGGPQDGLAGPFCGILAGHVIPYRYLERMTNGRGKPVLDDAGGFRCRHNLGAMSRALAESLGLPFATDEQVEAAARAAGKQRRERELKGLK